MEKVTDAWVARKQRRIRRRLRQAVLFWNSRISEIRMSITHSADRVDARFKWTQLVWQEILMYINLDRPVEEDDLRWLCRRRGFTKNQRAFLRQALCHLGLK